jgi:hypothetical protein
LSCLDEVVAVAAYSSRIEAAFASSTSISACLLTAPSPCGQTLRHSGYGCLLQLILKSMCHNQQGRRELVRLAVVHQGTRTYSMDVPAGHVHDQGQEARPSTTGGAISH